MLRPALLSLLLTSAAFAQSELPPPAPLDGAVDVPTTPSTTPSTNTPVDPAGALIGDAPPADGAAPDATPSTTTPATPRERVRLVYTPGAFADRCPSVDVVRDKVRGHLGYDPFGEPATRVVVLLLDGADATPARARVELLDPQLTPLGSRVIDANDGCDELVATAALQMSIALDPLAAPLPSTPPAAEPTTTEPMTTPSTSTPLVQSFQVPEARDPFAIRMILSLDAHVAMLMAQDPALFGIGIGAGARSDWWSVRGEFRFDFGGDDEDGIDSFPLLVSGLPCVHLPFSDLGEDGRFEFTGCLVATTGIVPVTGNNNGVGVYVGGGARTGIDWHFDDDTALRVFFQLEGAALRASWTTSELGAFSQSPVNIMFGLGGDIGDW